MWPDGQLAFEDGYNAAPVREDDDEIGILSIEVPTNISTSNFDEQRRCPTPIGVSLRDQPLP